MTRRPPLIPHPNFPANEIWRPALFENERATFGTYRPGLILPSYAKELFRAATSTVRDGESDPSSQQRLNEMVNELTNNGHRGFAWEVQLRDASHPAPIRSAMERFQDPDYDPIAVRPNIMQSQKRSSLVVDRVPSSDDAPDDMTLPISVEINTEKDIYALVRGLGRMNCTLFTVLPPPVQVQQ